MRIMKSVMRIVAITAVMGSVFATKSEAAIISISPATQNADLGDTVLVDILVSLGAGEEVGGFSFLLGFNSAIIQGVSYEADPDNAMLTSGCAFCDFSFGFGAGGASPLDMFVVSGSLDEAALQAAQGGGFRLATVSFLAVGAGTSALTLGLAGPEAEFLSDHSGEVALATQVVNGSVCVAECGEPPPPPPPDGRVPEPGTLALVGMGLAFAAFRRHRNRRG